MACLAQMNFWQGLSGFAIVIMAGLLIIVILLQRGRGQGLAGAFGGSGGSSAFGAKTGDVFTWITVVVATMVVLLAVVSNYIFDETPKPALAAVEAAPDAGETTTESDLPVTIETVPIEKPKAGEDAGGSGGDATSAAPASDTGSDSDKAKSDAVPSDQGGAAGGSEDPSGP